MDHKINSSGRNNVTQVDLTYLKTLKSTLGSMQTQVEDRIKGQGNSDDPGTTLWIGPVDSSLTVRAGGVGAGSGSGSTFDVAAALTSALSSMGGSVHDQLAWLDKVLGDMISEITATENAIGTTEGANHESVDNLISEFRMTIGTINKDTSFTRMPGAS
jgi:hypothetical protein